MSLCATAETNDSWNYSMLGIFLLIELIVYTRHFLPTLNTNINSTQYVSIYIKMNFLLVGKALINCI